MDDYSLFTVKRKNRGQKTSYWYVQFKDSETGEQLPQKSVDMLSRKLGDPVHHITKRPEAENVVQRAILYGLNVDGGHDQDTLFADYLRNFWDFDNSKYIKTENKLNPHSIGRDHASTCLHAIENHAIPLLPKGLKCSQVKTRHIETIQDSVLDTLSISSWLKVLNALRIPITELRRKKIILDDPLFYLKKVKPSSHKSKPKGCLSKRQADKLIAQMFNNCTYLKEVSFHYKHSQNCKRAGQEYDIAREVILDRRVYLATALGFLSGMRMGEILALRTKNIRFPNSGDDYENQAIIKIDQAYARKAKFKEPKSKKTRVVPIPRWLANELMDFASTNPWNNGLVFYSSKCKDTPFDNKAISQPFNKEVDYLLGSEDFESRGEVVDPKDKSQLEAIMQRGEELRKADNITFHSTRHYFDTLSFNAIGGEKTRTVIGHESESMTQLYYNVTDQEILEIGTKTIQFIKNPKDLKDREA